MRVDLKERSSAEDLLKEAWLQDDEIDDQSSTLLPDEEAIKQPSHVSKLVARTTTPTQSDLPTPPSSSPVISPLGSDTENELVNSSTPPGSLQWNLIKPEEDFHTMPPPSPHKIAQKPQKVEIDQHSLHQMDQIVKKIDQRLHEDGLQLLTRHREEKEEMQKFRNLEEHSKTQDAIIVEKDKKIAELLRRYKGPNKSFEDPVVKQMQELKQQLQQVQAEKLHQAEIQLLKHQVELLQADKVREAEIRKLTHNFRRSSSQSSRRRHHGSKMVP